MAETPFRKGSVTQTGVEATSLSAPDLRAASFSREGVVDRSGLFRGQAEAVGLQGIAGGVRDFGQIALDVDEGIAKANLESDLLDEIDQAGITDDFEEQQQNRLEEATLGFTAKEAKSNILREEIGEGAAIARMAPEFDDISKRLINAKRTGAISLEEFELRTTEALRRAVAKRPGLIRELTAHADNVLELSSAKQRVRQANRLAEMEGKAEADRRNRAIKQLDKANLPFDDLAPTEHLLNQLNTFRGQQLAWTQAKEIREANAQISKEEGVAALRVQGAEAAAGAYREAHDRMLSAFQTMNLSDAKLAAINIAAEYEGKFNEMGLSYGVINTPEFKALKGTYTDTIKQLSQTLQESGSGDDAARQMKNAMSGFQYAWKREVFESGTNPEMVRTFGYLGNYAQHFGLFLKQDSVQKGIQNALEHMALGMTNSNALDNLMHSGTNGRTSDFANLLGSMARSALPGEGTSSNAERHPADFEKAVQSASETISRNVGSNPDLAFKTLTDTIRELGDPAKRSHLNNATPLTKSTLVDMGLQQASALEPDRVRFLDNAKKEGVIIRSRVTPDGTLMFFTEGQTQKDRDMLRQFNSKFGVKYNDLIRFHSTLFNMSVPETSKLLSEVYSGGTREDVQRVIDSRRQGLQEDPVKNSVKERIKGEEGFREEAYLDQAGVPTIGYGFTNINGRPVQLGDSITREQAELELDKQVSAHSTFKKRVNSSLTREQEEALSSFEYNLGSGIWDGSAKPIITAINEGNLERAAEMMKRFNKVRNPKTGELEENKGLTNRRNREAAMLLGEA